MGMQIRCQPMQLKICQYSNILLCQPESIFVAITITITGVVRVKVVNGAVARK